MTLQRLTGNGEEREGKVLSDDNAAALTSAHQAIKGVLTAAGIDPDDTSTYEEDPDGTQDEPNGAPASAQDGTGSRSIRAFAVTRTLAPQIVTRRGGPSGAEHR